MAGAPKVRHKDPCPCGSGLSFDRCHGKGGTDAELATTPGSGKSETAEHLSAGAGLANTGPRGAIEPLLRAASLVPGDAAAARNLGLAYRNAARYREAVTWLRRAVALEPGVVGHVFDLAVALTHAGDHDAALAALEQVLRMAPGLAEAHGMAAGILLIRGRREDAALAYERAAACAPHTAYGALCEAGARAAQNRPREAEEALRRVVARDPSNSQAHAELGNLLLQSGSFDEAAGHFDRSIALAPQGAPWIASCYHGLVTSKRLTEADRPLVARIQSLLDMTTMAEQPETQVVLHFAAGKALDDLGDHAGAFRHFDDAHALRARGGSFDRRGCARGIDRILERYTREFFARSHALGDGDETPVLVVGMPRSGTTLVERMVSTHPLVGAGGELAFWSTHARRLVDAPDEKLADAAGGIREGYRRLLRSLAPGALRVTDKAPFNLFWAGIVHILFPRARIVHCRRDPIDTCVSIYATHVRGNWEFSHDRGDLAFYYREYLRLMAHWRSVLPPDRLLEVDYEDVTANPDGAARRLIAFCGLEWDPACARPDQNAAVVTTANTWQARQPVFRSSVGRWRRYEPWLGELLQLLPESARAT
jgi:tetratricopeptide (TPR) repeat protein